MMSTQGIGTQRGMQIAAPSRIAYKPLANHAPTEQGLQDRVLHEAIQDRVEDNRPVERRVNLAA